MIRRIILAVVAAASAWPVLLADAPSGYYSACEGKCGQALLTALYDKISYHTTISYAGLWNIYPVTDVRADGTIWDMYSTKHWPASSKCGSYSALGDCYNREHSMPKSWFNDASPMVSDAFHIYPTDGWVNGRRSNYPYGETATGSTMGTRNGVTGLGRLGACSSAGYSGTVFEPDDEYKGDFARTYFYMAACYNNQIAGWSSDMLAGNAYPAFKAWAVDLLLKWHRQDPVSAKERERNEAVAGYQHNRNPFIDHPELAEHVWGTKKSVAWSGAGDVEAAFNSPAAGATVDMGNVAVNSGLTATIYVRATALTSAVTATVSGDSRFTLGAATLAAAACNSAQGAPLTVTFRSATEGAATATVKLSSGSLSATFAVVATAYGSLTALEATDVTDDSFTARWVNIDPAGTNYNLYVERAGSLLPGYPVAVDAAACRYVVSGLERQTAYSYWLQSASLTSNRVSVTTDRPQPSVRFLFDADLTFYCQPDTPSDVAEILAEIDNIAGAVKVAVNAPFQVSLDRTAWSQSVDLLPGADRFYLRVAATGAGIYSTALRASAEGQQWDDAVVTAEVAASATFVERFTTAKGSYNEADYSGDASAWHFVDALATTQDGALPTDTRTAVRMGKTSASVISMTQDKPRGAGEATYYIRQYNKDGEAAMAVEYSVDGGVNWTLAETVAVTATDWTLHTTPVNVAGNFRLRFRQTAGARFNIGHLTISDYTMSGLESVIDYHRWDAHAAAGNLVIETLDGNAVEVAVYDMSGLTRYAGPVCGTVTLPLPAGLYIVHSADHTRRVLIP